MDLYVVLDDIRSALNVGAIFRTCDAVGAKKLFLTGITPYPPHNRIPKTALGAIDYVDWEYTKDKAHVINHLREQKISILSIELTEKATNLHDYQFPNTPTALVFGNEITGVSDEYINSSNETLYVPMYGKKESLNVATTVGITAYEFARQTY
ncbi:TrmH family RNA methyltransferase [Candidatus Dojkabacteria bacterium]|uniref:TrmH family RNA methyltransferase n=1 Tax=Candidatus Dojkabacteria bacterium TaxID=2099670 RepID=A0A955L7Q6_9BACT|nr:TrmH family RNA methyltransferase [Candidatus Dojkabacteria bacterium]